MVKPTSTISKKFNKHFSHTWLVLAIGILLIAIITVSIAIVAQPNNHQKDTSKTPLAMSASPTDVNNVMVGAYRYVNACRAFTAPQQISAFSNLSESALINGQYADATLPTAAILSTGVESNCSRDFESGTTFGDTTLIFSITQYPSKNTAAAAYDAVQPHQAEIDKVNQYFGTNIQISNNTAPLSGVSNTQYNPDNQTSYTIDGNKIISFSATLGSATASQFKTAIVAALPKVLVNVGNPKLAQSVDDYGLSGQKIGNATYREACALFSTADFKAVTGQQADPSDVEYQDTHAATTYFNTDTTTGENNNFCTRVAYPGTTQAQSYTVQIDYFKTAAEATQMAAQHLQQLTSDGDKAQTISGVGTYAFYGTASIDPGQTYFDVQSGPYVLELSSHVVGSDTATSGTSYTKAAATLLKQLK